MRLKAAIALLPLAIVFVVPTHVHAATTNSWTGLGDGTHWNDASNWSGDSGTPAIPANGDNVVFPAAIHDVTLNDNISGLALTSLTFQGQNITITDDTLTVTSEISDTASTGAVGDCDRLNNTILSTDLTIDASGAWALQCFELLTVSSSTTFTGSDGESFLYNTSDTLGAVAITTGNVGANYGGTLGSGTVTVEENGFLILNGFGGTETYSNPMVLNGGLVESSGGGTTTLSGPLTVNAGSSYEAELYVPARTTVDITGAVSGSAHFRAVGVGTIDFNGNLSGYSGTLVVGGDKTSPGIVIIDSNGTFPVHVLDGSLLEGTGTVGTVTSAGGIIGSSLTASSLTLDSASKVLETINGQNAGTDFTQIVSSGKITLGNAKLQTSLNYHPALGTIFTIVKSTKLSGTFAKLPEGEVFTSDGTKLLVSYKSHSGHDVTLTVVNSFTPQSIVITSSENPAAMGDVVTLTATLASNDGLSAPTGTVTFFEGSTNLGTEDIVSGKATVQIAGLGIATYPITAQYSGDSRYRAMTSGVFNQVVEAPVPSVGLGNSGFDPLWLIAAGGLLCAAGLRRRRICGS